MVDHERRQDPRMNVTAAVKIFDPASGKYRSGITRNLSAGGALVEVRGGMLASVGDQIGMAIDFTRAAGVVRHDDLKPVVVTRIAPASTPIARLVAVRFVEQQSVTRAA